MFNSQLCYATNSVEHLPDQLLDWCDEGYMHNVSNMLVLYVKTRIWAVTAVCLIAALLLPTSADASQQCGEIISVGNISSVWANHGGDKVTQEELRSEEGPCAVYSSLWKFGQIEVSGAKNEVVSFNVVLESANQKTDNVSVFLDSLTGPHGTIINSRSNAKGNELFSWTDRNIELFYVKYLQIKGLSAVSYGTYDERHIPERMRRPYDSLGIGSGSWQDRPDHDTYYPEIAVPLELEQGFSISKHTNQSIWVDIYIPKDIPAGEYMGSLSIQVHEERVNIPVQLLVRNFTLPDEPTSKTMLVYSRANVNNRYTGIPWPHQDSIEGKKVKKVRDAYFKVAHRHKISLIDDDEVTSDSPTEEWKPRLDGSLFTEENGYAGPGIGTGNGVYSIGTYGSWRWRGEGMKSMQDHVKAWSTWFQHNSPETEFFIYLIDESSNFPQVQEWATWIVNAFASTAQRIHSFATLQVPEAQRVVTNLDIIASTISVGDTQTWQTAIDEHKKNKEHQIVLYNGKRPATGSFAIEDDGVALRQLPWAQFKKDIDRWFYWESTYYTNSQGGLGNTNVFQKAQTFGGGGEFNASTGESGWNYSNGDGVLFYPGTDTVFPYESYGVDGPFASLRLKHWRRGIQDVDYLAMAKARDPQQTEKIIENMVPKVLWEYGIDDPNDPTWKRTDISWSTDPFVWEDARAQLAAIIEGTDVPKSTCPLITKQPYRYAGNATVYYITENCTKRAFTRADLYFSYFDSWNRVRLVSQNTLNKIRTDELGFMPWGPLYQPLDGTLLKTVTDPKVYLLVGGKRFWLTSEEVFLTLGYQFDWVEDVSEELLKKYPLGEPIASIDHHPNYTLITYVHSPKVYRLEPSQLNPIVQVKRHIKNEEAFIGLGFRWDRIVTIQDDEEYLDGVVLE